MRILLLLAVALLLARPAAAQSVPLFVPCSTISPAAVTVVPPPFNQFMNLICYDSSGQGLVPPHGTHWVDGHMDVGLTSMDDRTGPNGQLRPGLYWYVSLTPSDISPANDAALRQVLLRAGIRPQFVNGAQILELDAATSAGQLKQEFLIFPADPVATHGIKLLMECHKFCQAGDSPWILGVVPDSP